MLPVVLPAVLPTDMPLLMYKFPLDGGLKGRVFTEVIAGVFKVKNPDEVLVP